MAELGKAYIQVVPSMRGGVGQLTSELTGATTAASGKAGTGFAKGFGKTAIKAMGAIGIATSVGSIFSKGWDRMTAIDTARQKLKALDLDADAIKNSALEAVDQTAYGLDAAMTTAASAAAAGISAGDDMTRYLTNVADAAAMAGVGMDEMGSIFNKVAANGKLSTEEINQLADRGIPIWQMLADETGMTMDELRTAVSNGEVDLETFQRAMEEKIGGAAKDIGSNTIQGAISNIGASFSRMAANILGASDTPGTFASKLLPLMNKLMEFTKKIETGASVFGGIIGSILGPIMDGIGQVFSTLGNGTGKLSPIKDILEKTGTCIGAIVSALVPVLIPAIRIAFNIIGAIASVLGKVLNRLSAGWPVIQGLATVVGAVAKGILRVVNNVVKFVTGKLTFKGLVAKVKGIWKSVKDAITGPITKAKDKVAEIISKIKKKFPFNIGKIIKLKLPKIEIKTGSKEFFGKTVKYPTGFSIKWNAAGGIVDGATLIGAGEKGEEAIVPLDPFWQRLDEHDAIDYERLATVLINVLSSVERTNVMTVDGKVVARSTAPYMRKEINTLDTRANRALGLVGV